MQVRPSDGAVLARDVGDTPLPPGSVRVAVVACGVCNADIRAAAAATADGPPVTPGHEIAGVIAEIGAAVQGWAVGDRVAVGWFGGS